MSGYLLATLFISRIIIRSFSFVWSLKSNNMHENWCEISYAIHKRCLLLFKRLWSYEKLCVHEYAIYENKTQILLSPFTIVFFFACRRINYVVKKEKIDNQIDSTCRTRKWSFYWNVYTKDRKMPETKQKKWKEAKQVQCI